MSVRNFDWRDFALLQRVRNRGICLNSQLRYTRGPHTIQNTLIELLSPNRSMHTIVVRPDEDQSPEALGQVQIQDTFTQAHIAYLTPEEALQANSGMRLLERIARAAGERGCQALVADVDEGSLAFEILRKAGFGVYARQRVWRLNQPFGGDLKPQEHAWRPELRNDRSAIQALYSNIVPALVQQVEPPPERNGRGLVYWLEGEMLGYLDIVRGPSGIWIQPYFHPAATLSDDLLAGFIRGFSPSTKKPVYVNIRSYQGGLGGSLDRLGFTPCNDQAVLVKRLAHLVTDRLPSYLPAIEGTQPEPTASFTHLEQRGPTSTRVP